MYKNTVKVQQTIKLLGKSLQCHRAPSKKCVSKNCILKEKNEKKRGNLTLLKTIKRDNALNTANEENDASLSALILRDFQHTDARNGCMHARNGCNKVFSDTCNGRTHSHSPLCKIFRLDVVAMLVISSVCMRHGRTTIGERDENRDPDGRKQ